MLGHQVLTAGNSALAQAMIEQWHPRAVFVDLAAGDLVKPEALLAYRTVAGPETAFIAFGSHVDTASLAAASAAGCDPVLPRSKFSAELPELIRRFLGGDGSATS
jgi:CheY-like chemotaxis protein